jgi:voltage-gated potassium channel Kch
MKAQRMIDGARQRRPRLSLHARARRAASSGHVIPYLAGSIAVTAVLTGFVSTLIDRRDFPTFGDGIWWAIVTLGTVGYGDIVPHTAWGRVLGSIVIVFGVTFISLLFATVTSYLVASDQEEGTTEALQEISSRLAAIEAELVALRRPD